MDHIDPGTLKQAVAPDEGATHAWLRAGATPVFADVGGPGREVAGGVVESRRTAISGGGSLRVEQLRLRAPPEPAWMSMPPEATRGSHASTKAPRGSEGSRLVEREAVGTARRCPDTGSHVLCAGPG